MPSAAARLRLSAIACHRCACVAACRVGLASRGAPHRAVPTGDGRVALHGRLVGALGGGLRLRAAAAGDGRDRADGMRAMTVRAVAGSSLGCLLPAAGTGTWRRAEQPLGWTFDPWVVAAAAARRRRLYARRHVAVAPRRLRARVGAGRPRCMPAAGLALAGALLSPLHALGEQLFTAHMVEHEIVMAVAAPLLVLARAGRRASLWAWPAPLRQALGRVVRPSIRLRAAWSLRRPRRSPRPCCTALAIWVWHVPALFDAAVTHLAAAPAAASELPADRAAVLVGAVAALRARRRRGASVRHHDPHRPPGRAAHLRAARALRRADGARRATGG